MPRQLRVQFPGAMYHVMSRGNRGDAIFLDDVDRHSHVVLKILPRVPRIRGPLHLFTRLAPPSVD
jgi:hypothetical protein